MPVGLTAAIADSDSDLLLALTASHPSSPCPPAFLHWTIISESLFKLQRPRHCSQTVTASSSDEPALMRACTSSMILFWWQKAVLAWVEERQACAQRFSSCSTAGLPPIPSFHSLQMSRTVHSDRRVYSGARTAMTVAVAERLPVSIPALPASPGSAVAGGEDKGAGAVARHVKWPLNQRERGICNRVDS